MYIFDNDRSVFARYSEDKIYAILNIATVIRLLAKKPLTIPQLSEKINPPEALEHQRSKYDTYAIIKKMVELGYVQKIKNISKFKTSKVFCTLTEEGEQLLKDMPKHLLLGRTRFDIAYNEYKSDGLAS